MSDNWKIPVCAVMMMFAASAANGQTTWHVDDDNVCPGSGTKVDPFCTIQAGIDAAVNGDEVLVAGGTYNEVINFNGKAITLRSTDPLDPAVVAVTIIDANGAGTVVTCTSGEGPDTVLNGFTITGGNATKGGGMFNDGSSPTVTNCTFTGNTATFGGGMSNTLSTPTVTNCTFTENTATFGGGMYGVGLSDATVTNCTFSGNTATVDGGGMFNGVFSDPTVTNCTFSGNTANGDGGGGMFNCNNSSPTVTNCTFTGNSANGLEAGGGGMFNDIESDPTVSNCTFSRNTATFGGGMFNQDSSPTVTNCTFSGNSANGGSGGGMYNLTPGIFTSSPTVSNCTFSGNTATVHGGGMFNDKSNPTLINCTFSGNTATFGGGMYNRNFSFPTVTNCTFSANTAAAHTGGGIYDVPDGSTTVTNCIFWGNVDTGIFSQFATVTFSAVQRVGFPGKGNIIADPLFLRSPSDGGDGWGDDPGTPDVDEGANDDFGDLRLMGGSPCINAGDTTALPGDSADLDGDGDTAERTPLDLDGLRRAVCTVDMGAYEFQFLPTPIIENVTQGTFYCTIQEAIDDPNTVAGDEIVVSPGTYVETINFNGKAITLRSTDPLDPAVVAVTIIDANAAGSVVTCNSGEGPDTVLNGFTITGGNATNGGGMFNIGSNPTVTNCTFTGNMAESNGGGMYNIINDPTVTNCTFSGNSANFDGGGMFNSASNPTVTNCTFTGNTAGRNGGGMFNSASNPTVTNCTFSGNTATSDGGGMWNAESNPTVTNCILWGDSPNEINGTPTVGYSDVQGGLGAGTIDGGGNINADPLFVDAYGPDNEPGTEDDDLRLLPGSPCIDAADNAAVPADVPDLDGDGDTAEQIPLDLDGYTRFADDPATVDTGNPPGAETIVEMGAYEYLAGDGDRDGDTDLFDHELFVDCLTGPGGGVPAECIFFDMDADGDVDHYDYAVLQIAFTESN